MHISRVAVVGGSICGLTTALLLRDAGFEVDVYERSPQPLAGFGTGIVVQPELVRYLVERGAVDVESISVPSSSMRYVDATTGTQIGRVDASWRFTAYDLIYRELHRLFGAKHYRLGRCLVGLDQDADGVSLRFADSTSAEADFVVAADGGNSVVRQRLTGLTPSYAGYVTWRGLLDPHELPESERRAFDDAFTYGLLPDGHLIAYPIPGRKDGEPRRLNFQWYWNVPPGPQLDELMTDCRGTRRPVSVHTDSLCDRQIERLDERALGLAAPFAEMVRRAQARFVTIVSDAEPSALVHGRVALVGDAAVTPRPHAAAGAAKAAADGWELAEALAEPEGLRNASLASWERSRLDVGHRYLAKVRLMADRLQHGGEFPPGAPEFRFGLPQPGDRPIRPARR